ncbi:putative membrane protein [Mycobacterium kansasii]|uniref:Putative membrane protein n=1 Tax=Mycobacterium kansasii TaxID=1768 RepID=A0A1V3WHL6_MYCKA|nr:putative membrane protein [Mycobacterium kansasii]
MAGSRRLSWSLTMLAAVALIARGIFLGRPVTAMHAAAAALFLVAGLGLHVLSFDLAGEMLIAGSGLVLMWPTSSHPRPAPYPGCGP